MIMGYLLLFLMLFLSCSTNDSTGSIEISDVWIREVPPNSDITALYFEIKNNTGMEDWIVSINSTVSEKAEIHNTVIENDGSAKMVKLEEVKLPSDGSLKLQPAGMHVMLIGLKKEISAGKEYQINFNFKNSGNKTVTARVKSLEESMNGHSEH